MRRIVKRMTAGKFLRLLALALAALLAAATSFAPAHAAQVAVTVEKLTVDGKFIVEPTLVTLNGNIEPLSVVTLRVLDAKFKGGKGTAYDYTGTTTSAFYLTKVYDPDNDGLLGEFDAGTNLSGWMVTLNNSFIKASAASFSLVNRNVVRWQFTKTYGNDIGTDVETLGKSRKDSKDDLIWKVALINDAGNESAYGSAYTTAVNVLADLGATKGQISNALAALNAVNPDGGDNNNNGGGDDINPGGSGDPDDDDSPSGSDDPDDDDSPDNSGNSEDSTAPGVQDTPAVTPTPGSGLEAGKTQSLTAERADALGFGDLVAETAGGGVAVKPGEYASRLEGDLKNTVKTDTLTPLDMPDTKEVTAKATALFSIKASLDNYEGKAFSDIAVLKMTNEDSGRQVVKLTMAGALADLVSGSYVWTEGKSGSPLKKTDKAKADTPYYLSVAIEDDSIYDSDTEAGTVVDPLALAIADTSEQPNGGGGGGCDAGASGILALSLAALASVTARRRGR
jgi:hypothetical protein